MTWMEITPEGAPVRGLLQTFDAAKNQWSTGALQADQLKEQFRAIIDGENLAHFEGAAAQAFAEVVKGAQVVLDDVPTVFRSIGSILGDHAGRLRDLQAASDAALARAKVARAERQTAAGQAAATSTRIASLQRQAADLRALPPEQSASKLALLDQQVAQASSQKRSQVAAASAAQSRVSAELTTWTNLRQGEDDLNRWTAERLKRVDLKSLANPSLLRQGFDAVTGFVGGTVLGFLEDLAHDLVGFYSSLAKGEFGQALWHLRGYLDKLLTVLAIVAFVATIAVIAVGSIATGGALLLALGAVAVALSGAKLATTAVLVSTQTENKETGERLGLIDLALDGAEFALNVVTFGKAGSLMNASKTSVAFRYMAKENSIVMKNFGRISARRTVETVTKEIAKEIAENVIEDQGVDLAKRVAHETATDETRRVSDFVYGTPASRTRRPDRHQIIQADIDVIKPGARGIAAPVQTVLVDAN